MKKSWKIKTCSLKNFFFIITWSIFFMLDFLYKALLNFSPREIIICFYHFCCFPSMTMNSKNQRGQEENVDIVDCKLLCSCQLFFRCLKIASSWIFRKLFQHWKWENMTQCFNYLAFLFFTLSHPFQPLSMLIRIYFVLIMIWERKFPYKFSVFFSYLISSAIWSTLLNEKEAARFRSVDDEAWTFLWTRASMIIFVFIFKA